MVPKVNFVMKLWYLGLDLDFVQKTRFYAEIVRLREKCHITQVVDDEILLGANVFVNDKNQIELEKLNLVFIFLVLRISEVLQSSGLKDSFFTKISRKRV